MSERNSGYPAWFSTAPDLAYLVGDIEGEARIAGLLIYGDIDKATLQNVQLRRLSLRPGDDVPAWRQEQPPTRMQVMAAHGRAGTFHDPATGKSVQAFVRDLTDDEWRQALTRIAGEDPDRFYRRVAKAYLSLGQSTGKPVTRIAELAGVPRGTAAAWVNRARTRGYLAATTSGRVS